MRRFNIMPLLLADAYKASHRVQYPKGTQMVYSNWTPRKSRIKGVNHIINFGLQAFIKEYFIDRFNNDFFSRDEQEVCLAYKQELEAYLGGEYDVEHIISLHKLGYLPIQIKALPEGTRVPIGVPPFTVKNTLPNHPEFYWLVNYIETLISDCVWQPMTSATIADQYKQLFERWAKRTGSKHDIIPGLLNNVEIQGHDFSMRGMSSPESAIVSGMGHLLSFKGTDTIPAIPALKYYYGAEKDFIGCSVPATEHSVMCAGEKDSEIETFKRLICDIYPSGIVSIVSDTWDLFRVLSEYLPKLKDYVMARNGKVVIRPDSGNPIDIIAGVDYEFKNGKYLRLNTPENIAAGGSKYKGEICEAEAKGVVQMLYEVFGGTVNELGFKELDSHIGCIYGDAITLERADAICERLYKKGFASTNWVAGIGSYTYQYNSRDTFGFAMKATYVIVNGEGREIFKDPITDGGTKKSAKGLLMVYRGEDDELKLKDQCTPEEEESGLLETVFIDGKLVKETTLSEIRTRMAETMVI